MNELEQVWRERIDWVQASGQAFHADCRGDDRKDNPARPSEALDSSRTAQRVDLPGAVLIHDESRQAANPRHDKRESRRRLATTPAGTATAASPPDPSNTGPPKSDAAGPNATSRGP
jgi:hypothetical protein